MHISTSEGLKLMKKIKSLVAAFTLATAGMMTMGAAPASAQTVPVNGGQVWNEQIPAPATTAYVSQEAIDNLAYNVGVQTPYYRDGRGFTQGTANTGENIGLEFTLNGANATVVRAYNLDDPASRAQFQAEINTAYANDRALAANDYANAYTYYAPETYVVCPSPVAVIGIGWGIRGWFPGYVPVYTPWFGFWEGGHRIHHREEIIIERGREHNIWAGGHGYYDNNRGREHVETRHVEPQHFEPRNFPQQRFEQHNAPQQRFEQHNAPQQRFEPRNNIQQPHVQPRIESPRIAQGGGHRR